jgi:glutathione reductase (NADPH)
VTILEALPRLLGNMDAEAVTQLHRETERIGVGIHAGVEVKRIELAGERLRVVYEESGSERTAEANRVVNGAGRVANVESLDLAAGKVTGEQERVALDGYLRSTSNPAVYVCGDSHAGHAQLSPIATYEGRIVGSNIVEGPKRIPDYSCIPSCVFTVPALASVGLTQAAAEADGTEHRVAVNDVHEWLSGRTYAETAAWAKVVIDNKTDRILGAHVLGHAGEELIHIFALAMKHGITATDLRDFVYGFPTFSADIKSML